MGGVPSRSIPHHGWFKQERVNQMRVVAGTYRNRNLKTPEGYDLTRPTMDRVKEALFNILGLRVRGAYVVDLFAGSGSLGIEALSRGAKFVVFNDRHPRALACIRENLHHLQVPTNTYQIYSNDALKTLDLLTNEEPISILLLDPPYRDQILEEILVVIERRKLLSQDGIVVLECPTKTMINDVPGYLIKEYNYGNKKLVFLFRLNEQEE